MSLRKAGSLYVGKRGGLWQDAKHTIPYKRSDHVNHLKGREAKHAEKNPRPSKKRSLVQRMFGKKPDAIDALASIGHDQRSGDMKADTKHHARQLAQHGDHQLVATTPKGKAWASGEHKHTAVPPKHQISSHEAMFLRRKSAR